MPPDHRVTEERHRSTYLPEPSSDRGMHRGTNGGIVWIRDDDNLNDSCDSKPNASQAEGSTDECLTLATYLR